MTKSYSATKAETQSGLDRVKWAEGLILQLPPNHDGRNSWLLNYGRGPVGKANRSNRGLGWDEETQSARPAIAKEKGHE